MLTRHLVRGGAPFVVVPIRNPLKLESGIDNIWVHIYKVMHGVALREQESSERIRFLKLMSKTSGITLALKWHIFMKLVLKKKKNWKGCIYRKIDRDRYR